MFYLGIGLWLGSPAALSLPVLTAAILLTYIYRHETKELEARFGQAYREYRQSMPFLIPRRPPKRG